MAILKNLLAAFLILSASTHSFADDGNENKALTVKPNSIYALINAINSSLYDPPQSINGGRAQWTMDSDIIEKQLLIASADKTYESVAFMITLLEFYIGELKAPTKENPMSPHRRLQAIENAQIVLKQLKPISNVLFSENLKKLRSKFTESTNTLSSMLVHITDSDIKEVVENELKLSKALSTNLKAAYISSKKNAADLSTNLSTSLLKSIQESIFDLTKKNGSVPGDIIAQSRINKINDILITANNKIIEQTKRDAFFKSLSLRFPKNPSELKSSLSSFKKILTSQFIGQNETIEALISMRRGSLIRGQKISKHVVLMGEPGSGKDTAAMALTDAIHGRKGAYQDHMFSVDVMRKEADLWKTFGSATGYLGSDGLPPFLEFLVKHSSGRYEIKETKGQKGIEYSIIESETWAPDQALEPGTFAPQEAVVYVNEFHNWSKDMKDAFLKIALQEDGYFPVNNPKGGVSKLYVPVNLVIATNNGMELLSSRNADGKRFGAPLSYEDRMGRWGQFASNKDDLKTSLSLQNGSGQGEKEQGISEELLNRLQNIVLMRPHSPETMKEIATMKTKSLGKSFAQGMLSKVSLEFDANVHEFLVDYDFSSEAGMRFVNEKVIRFIEDPLNKAIDTEQLKIPTEETTWLLRFVKNKDLTSSLEVKVLSNGNDKTVFLDLPSTQKDKLREPLSQEKINEIVALEEQINSQVFGVSHITPQLIEVALETEEKLNEKIKDEYKDGKKANVMMFLGKSSTGKTYLAETYGKLKHGDKSKVVTIDFGQINSKDQINELILGKKDPFGKTSPSKFMQEYDRAGGKITFIFDEVANTHPEILKALYDVLRQSVVTTFSDGKERSMAGVDIIMTGNAGEEIYNQIPKDIPDNQKLAAMNRAYMGFMKSAGMRRGILEKFFSDAFLNRVGERNIFFFGPLSYKSLRQVTQLKVEGAFRSLSKTGNGKKSWKLQVASQQDLVSFYEIIESAGFVIDEQGASVDKFVKESVEAKLRSLLIRNGVKTGSTVTLKTLTTQPKIMPDGALDFSYDIAVFVDNKKEPLILELEGKKRPTDSKIRETNQILTAYHETGHELVRKILLGFDVEGQEITIIPGVDTIGGRIVHYLGVARSQQKYQPEMTREYAVRRIAVLAAGYIAESMVTEGARHTAGKSNDMLRATEIAKNAIAKWGLSEEFGTSAIGPDETMDTFFEKLSAEKKAIFQKEVDALITEGAYLAREALTVNNKAFINMGRELAEKGTLKKQDLSKFYAENVVLVESEDSYLEAAGQLEADIAKAEEAVTKANQQQISRVRGRGTLLKIKEENYIPDSVANIDSIIAAEKAEAIAEVELSKSIQIAKKDTFNIDKLVSIKKAKTATGVNSPASACARALN